MNELNEPITKYYDEVKNNMVKVLNEIVENYVYRNSEKMTYEGRFILKG